MALLIGLLVVGVILGYALRNQRLFVGGAAKLVTLAVYLLLFTLGISIGGDKAIFDLLPELGLKSVVLTVGAIGGTVVAAWAFGRFVVGLPQKWKEMVIAPEVEEVIEEVVEEEITHLKEHED